MNPSFARLVFFVVFGFCLQLAQAAEFRVSSLFSDGAVLQRGKSVPVWGWADPGTKVEVGYKGTKAAGEADSHGRWQVELPAMEASSDPGDLTVQADGKTLTSRDVVVGDVWLCSGQSNMEWRVDQSRDADQEIAAADYPFIRQFRVPKTYQETPQSTVKAQWTAASSGTVKMFSGVAYFFARDIHQSLNIPIGLINASFGGKMIETFMSPEALAASEASAAVKKRWETELAGLPAKLETWKKQQNEGAPPKGMNPGEVVAQHRPGCLFNAMLHPLFPYAIRGILWYQGEHNIARAEEYRSLFPSFIRDMRQKLGQGDVPFYYVQLANYDAKLDKSREGYAKLREVQLETLALPNTGMAVTIDIGTPDNVHPINKQDVGLRLARWAKAKTYGMDNVISGPLLKSVVKDGRTLKISFDHIGGGLKPAEPLGSFELAGPDGSWHPAQAQVDGEQVLVEAEGVSDPGAVRYAWGNSPVATLFNQEGLPASPFRYTLPQ